jgi:hypothetical protein
MSFIETQNFLFGLIIMKKIQIHMMIHIKTVLTYQKNVNFVFGLQII